MMPMRLVRPHVRIWRPRLLQAAVLLAVVLCGPAKAHLMVAQQGTLNIVEGGAYLVLSVPVSAFQDIDDDGDALLSLAELRRHGSRIEWQVLEKVQLRDPVGPRPLQGLLLNPSPPDGAPDAPADQLVVMGRFELGAQANAADALIMTMELFGRGMSERSLRVTITDKPRTRVIQFVPSQATQPLFPSAGSVFLSHLHVGAEHVLVGLDLLLFLLVVVAAAWRPRELLWALTCFTAGHAVTLTGSLWAGWSVPSAVVEPAIAASIVGMVLFDAWSRRRERAPTPALRLSLVFGCALIHGLALAGALSEQGLDRQHFWLSLAGFNAGVELGQILVATPAVLLLWALRRWRGPSQEAAVLRLASLVALSAGGLWFAQRVFAWST